MYTVDYFIQKFEAIPTREWATALFENGAGQHCALGHCNVKGCSFINGSAFLNENEKEGQALIDLLKPVSSVWSEGFWVVSDINDGYLPKYDQPTAKQRILAALDDVKKMQQPEYVDITKSLAVLPVEETADKPLTHA